MATPQTPRGALIAIEGLDRAGKSTQCDLLLKRLLAAGIPAKLQKFPDRSTPIGHMINSYLTSSSNLDDQAIHLLFSANRWEARDSILSTLSSGTTLLLDRYIYSGVVFSAAKPHVKVENPRPLSVEWCRAPDVGLPRPDVIIFLDVEQEVAEMRGGFGGERYEKREMQGKVRRLFEELRSGDDAEDWRVVNAGGTVEEVAEEVWRGVEEGLRRAKESGGVVRSIE